MIHRIENDPPVPPRQLDHKIPLDLETIVLKALSKDPGHRFASALEFAAELRRFVEGRPIRSRPIPFYQQFERWCKRNPKLAAANIAVATLMTGLAVVSTIAAFIYHNDNLRIHRAENTTLEQLTEALQARARAGRFSRQMGQRFDSLDALARAAAIAMEINLPRERLDARLDALRNEAIACAALPDLKRTGWVRQLPPGALCFVFDSTMTRYALRFRDGTIEVRRVADDQQIACFDAAGTRDIWVFCFSPDGRYLATTHDPGHALIVWDVDRRAIAVRDPGRVWRGVRFSPDSRRIAVAHEDGGLFLWDLANGRPSQPWPTGRSDRLAFRPDGGQIAIIDNGAEPPICRILEGVTGRLVYSFPLRGTADDVAWGAADTILATAGHDSKIDLWDTVTGIRRATLEGHTSSGLSAEFHPAGSLLASHGWDNRLWLWDPVLGRSWLSLTSNGGACWPKFSQDGRIVLSDEDKLTTYQVDPALEYRTLANATNQPIEIGRASVRHDGQMLAVPTRQGVVLWDLAHGTQLGTVGVGHAMDSLFEESGDLLTAGDLGVWRWPVRVDRDRGIVHIGPPDPLPLHGRLQIAEDRSGRIVAQANVNRVDIVASQRAFALDALDDVRGVAVSPDGEWLATSSFSTGGIHLWRASDGKEVFKLPIDYGGRVGFSPDGRRLLTGSPPCRLWAVGTWRKALEVGGIGLCFSPDSRMLAVQDATRIIRLVETATGRTLAGLESPDLCDATYATFSPDGSRLVVTTNEPRGAVHVWDLRAIRKHLTKMGLDWDAPAYSEDDPAAPTAPPFLRIEIDPLEDQFSEGAALAHRGRWEEAAAAYARGFAVRAPDNAPRWFEQALLRLAVDDAAGYRSTCRHMLDVLGSRNELEWLEFTAHACVLAPDSPAERTEALQLAQRRARAPLPATWSDHILGMALYRAGRFVEAEALLRASLDRDPDWAWKVLDWLVLAMAQKRLGRPDLARRWLERAESWVAPDCAAYQAVPIGPSPKTGTGVPACSCTSCSARPAPWSASASRSCPLMCLPSRNSEPSPRCLENESSV